MRGTRLNVVGTGGTGEGVGGGETGSRSSGSGGSSGRAAIEREWNCSVCAGKNTAADLACARCGGPNLQGTTWSCPACTFSNPNTAKMCEMCKGMNPHCCPCGGIPFPVVVAQAAMTAGVPFHIVAAQAAITTTGTHQCGTCQSSLFGSPRKGGTAFSYVVPQHTPMHKNHDNVDVTEEHNQPWQQLHAPTAERLVRQQNRDPTNTEQGAVGASGAFDGGGAPDRTPTRKRKRQEKEPTASPGQGTRYGYDQFSKDTKRYPPVAFDTKQTALYQQLRAWAAATARASPGNPEPYQILTRRSMAAVVVAETAGVLRTAHDLLCCFGFGSTKCDLYGIAVLQVIRLWRLS